MMYKIGDFYKENGLSGVVIYVDNSGNHGLIISLDEKHCNWYDSQKWCSMLGDGWKIPSYDEILQIANDFVLKIIQQGLIRHGMPLCFGDPYTSGANLCGHMYWTRTTGYTREEKSVFCLGPSGFESFSSDLLDSNYVYARAIHKF